MWRSASPGGVVSKQKNETEKVGYIPRRMSISLTGIRARAVFLFVRALVEDESGPRRWVCLRWRCLCAQQHVFFAPGFCVPRFAACLLFVFCARVHPPLRCQRPPVSARSHSLARAHPRRKGNSSGRSLQAGRRWAPGVQRGLFTARAPP